MTTCLSPTHITTHLLATSSLLCLLPRLVASTPTTHSNCLWLPDRGVARHVGTLRVFIPVREGEG